MFKTRKKDVRRAIKSKTAEDASDDEAGNVSDASVGTPPPTAAAAADGEGQARPKKMRKKIKAKSDKGPKPVLSFGHEDEEDSGIVVGKAAAGKREDASVFRVKKTKASKVGRRAVSVHPQLGLPSYGQAVGRGACRGAGREGGHCL